jgi:hypothetical protein
MSEFNIYPNLKKTILIVKAKIHVYEYKVFEHAKIACQLLDENGNLVENRTYILDTTNGFNDWSNDDKYLINWIKDKLQNNI